MMMLRMSRSRGTSKRPLAQVCVAGHYSSSCIDKPAIDVMVSLAKLILRYYSQLAASVLILIP